jgi:hypothetical protein
MYICMYICMYVCMYVCVKQLQVNSLGDTWSRNRYRDALIKYFTARRPFLSSLSQHRYGMVRFLSHPSFCFSTSVYLHCLFEGCQAMEYFVSLIPKSMMIYHCLLQH